MKQLSRLAQIREDLNFATILLIAGFSLGVFAFTPQLRSTASNSTQTSIQ